MKVMLVTGGAGFIGSNFVRYFLRRNKNFLIVNLDKLTYAGNLDNLQDIEDNPRHHFIKGDICNYELVNYIFKKYKPDYIINFAAEADADRSISHPSRLIETNVTGTLTLLEAARYIWNNHSSNSKFIQISTDAVYGNNLNSSEYFMEDSEIAPSNPYSASKASADLMVQAYSKTFNLPAIITRSCNNYGPYQHMEKFIPSCIINALQDKPIPIYGDGRNTREWIHVLDHCIGIIRVMFYGKPGEIYNIGSGEETNNLDIANRILKVLDKPEDLIRFTDDKPGHDKRYALNCYKIRSNLNWSSKYKLDDGITDTVRWYKDNQSLWKN